MRTIKTKKVLIYTVASNDSTALGCSALLHKSLKKFLKTDFDFQIVVPEQDSCYVYSPEIKPYIYPVYNQHYINQSILALRFHHKIFEQKYDYYIYLDSDILWTIERLWDLNYNTICFEQQSMLSKSYSRFWSSTDKSSILPIAGINSGFFGLKSSLVSELSEFMIRNLFNQGCIKKNRFFLDQNMFNLFIHKNYFLKSIESNNWQHMTHKFRLFAQPDSPYIPQTNYHFCGNLCNMEKKLDRMNAFITNNHLLSE